MLMSNVNNSRSYNNEENKSFSSPTKKQVIRDTIGHVKNTKEFTLGNQPAVNKSPMKNQGSNMKRKVEKQGNSLQTSISSSNIQASIDPLMIGRNTIPLKKLQDLTQKSQQNPLLQRQQPSNNPILDDVPSKKQSASSLSKNYKYWIDIKDLHSVLLFALSHFTISNDRGDIVEQDLSHSIIIEDLKLDQDQVQFLRSFAHQDFESRSVLKSYLNEHKNVNLSQVFDVNSCWIYLIENAKVITQVYKNKQRSDMVAALQMINEKFEQYQNKYQNKTLRLCFSEESELYTILVKILGVELAKNMHVRKICQVLYEACLKFREQYQDSTKPIMIMKSYVYIKLELHTRGRDVFDQQQNSYPLHKAVFEQNLPLISRFVKGQYEGTFYQDKNAIDPCGNTPLILAVKLGHIDTIKVLCDLTCCPKLKSLQNFPCALDVASSIKVKEIIKILLEANQKIKQHYLEMNKEAMFRALESLPDFKLDMNFQFQSNFIPFIGSIAPSDTYKIYKLGSKLRLDMTLVGFKNLKSIRGNLSVLFKGRSQDNEGELFVVDHDTKNVTNLFNQVVGAKLDKDLDDIMADAQYQKMYKADQFLMEPVIEGRTGQVMNRVIEGFNAEKYKMKTRFTMTKYKIDVGQVQSIKQYRDFQEYIDSARNNEFGIDRTIQDEEEIMVDKKNFNSTAPGPLQFQRGNSQERSNPNLPTFIQNDSTSLNTIMGTSSNNKKTTQKTINASIWLCNKYPLSLDSFLPLLQVLSFSSKQIAKFKDYLMKYQLPPGSFPLRAKIPIFFTMKAAFSLQNLSLNPSDLNEDLFNIDQHYLSQRINLRQQLQPSQIAAANLNDIYNMIKTNPQEDEEEDLESMQRANDMFNSMIRKEDGNNQQEVDLLFLSNINEPEQMEVSLAENYSFQNQQHLQSFHSEMDSIDLSERQVNDGKAKVAAHAFSQIQTMNQINGRHEGLEDTLNAIDAKLIISRAKIQLVGQHGRNQKKDLLNIKSSASKISTIEAENLFDTKYPEEKPTVNATSIKRMITKMQKPPLIAQPITPSGSISILSQTGKQDLASTLKKKAFNQKHQIKNYKNLIKYSGKTDKPLQISESSSYGGQSLRTGEESQGATILLGQRGSTADNSIATIMDQSSSMISGMKWFKQIIEYKNAILGQKEAPGYLQTIESEEILPTEGCQVEKSRSSKIGFVQQFGASSIINNNYSFVSQEDDLTVRKSLQNPSNLASFEKQSLFSNNSQSIQGKGKAKLFSGDSKYQFTNQKPLINHKHLINRFQDYVTTNKIDQNIQKQAISNIQQQKTPLGSVQRANSNRDSSSPPRNIGKSMDHSFENKNALGSFIIDSGEISQTKRMSSILLKNQPNQGNQPSFNYLPPKMSHKRQSSFGDNQQSAQKFIQSQYNKSAGMPTSNNQTKAQNQILINKSSESGQFNAPSMDATIFRDQNFNIVPPISSIQMGIQNYSASAIYNAGQPSRQDAHLLMMHAHSHNIPKKGTNIERNDYPQVVVQPFSTIYGDDLNSSQSHLSLSQQATIGIKNQVATGLLGAPTKKIITMQKKYNEGDKIMLTESGSSQSLINKGIGQNQLSKKTSDVDIVLSYQV